MSEEQKPVFAVEKIYVKDLSIEVPNAPGIFLERAAPDVHVELNTKTNVLMKVCMILLSR